MDRRLYRSRHNKKIAGVCGGIAEYFNIDPVIVRIIWLMLAYFGAGILLYIVAAIVIPERREVEFFDKETADRDYGSNINHKRSKVILGIILILAAAVMILKEISRYLDFSILWPILLIIVGLVIILKDRKGH